MREKGRAGVYFIAGLYLLYNAYQVFGFRNDNQGQDMMLMIIFSIIFLVAGLGLVIASFYIMKKVKEKEQELQKKQEGEQKGVEGSQKKESQQKELQEETKEE